MLLDIKKLLGKNGKAIIKPIALLTIDTIFNMFFYGMLYLVLLDLIQGTFSLNKIKNYSGCMVIAFVFRAIVNIKGYSGIQSKGARVIEHMRISLGDHLRKLNLGYFNKSNIGDLSNLLTSELQEFEMVLTHSTSDVIKSILISVYLIILTFYIDTTLALIQLIAVAVAIPIIRIGGKKVVKIGTKKKVVVGKVVSRIVEYLNGVQVFKAYNIAGEKFERLEQTFRDFKKESIRTEVSIVPYVLLFQVIIDLSFPVLLLIAVARFGQGNIDKIELLTFIVVNIALTNILRAFSAQYGQIRYFKVACEKLIKAYEEEEMPYKYESTKFKNYNIEFKNVAFKYEDDQETLKDINFVAKEGTMTALIGPSGSGKTTITSLIARFWDVNKGKITVGGKNIKDIDPDYLLSHISMVFQDVYLINDTVYNNIKLGNVDATKEQVIKAAKLANCDEFVSKLDDGYDTMVGEGGSTLSGGEKQRVSIARAILKDAPIILLDEATASLDADSELEIRKAIKKLTKNKTVIVIAHRLNTIKDAEQIIVLNKGKVEECGDHKKLIKSKGRYYNMYNEMEKAKLWSI